MCRSRERLPYPATCKVPLIKSKCDRAVLVANDIIKTSDTKNLMHEVDDGTTEADLDVRFGAADVVILFVDYPVAHGT